jgi:hypothetical protein
MGFEVVKKGDLWTMGIDVEVPQMCQNGVFFSQLVILCHPAYIVTVKTKILMLNLMIWNGDHYAKQLIVLWWLMVSLCFSTPGPKVLGCPSHLSRCWQPMYIYI